MPERTRPKPKNRFEQAYWDALARHRLSLQVCKGCGFVRHPPGEFCPECWSGEFEWQPMSGTGSIVSIIWYMKSLDARFPEVPYNVVLVKLAEGPALISNVVGSAFGEINIGDPVRACYCDEKDFTALLFEKGSAE